MSKHSKKSKESRKDTTGICDYAKWQQESNESDRIEHQKMIDRRRRQAPGLEICPDCGGVVWNLGDVKRCGDCRCKF